MVLVFAGQPISDEQHIAFSRNFGTREVFPRKENQAAALPEILRVANTDEQGRHLPPQRAARPGSSTWQRSTTHCRPTSASASRDAVPCTASLTRVRSGTCRR
jgi:hypothetical protein